ncbi:cytochrome P450 94B3-like [Cocos nucifera]|uniref:Cytochrome P450 94B3-like n=1 Tax=Cocos nucifera TaxID=13894 RepID=A0A8K0IM71_COCNU|nr:cytochrome P450 94B3-like [Cocos nucifera]
MDPSLLLPPILFLSFLSLFFLHRKNKSHIGPAPKISFLEAIRNGHRFIEWTAELVLASPTNTIILPSTIITGNPNNIEHVLKTNFDNYQKGDNVNVLEDFLGRGISNTDGDHWKLQRKIASLEFKTKTIRTFILDNVHREAVDRLLPLLSEAAVAGETVDLQDLLDRLAFDNMCKFAFDVDPARLKGETEDTGRFVRAFGAAMDISVKRFQQPRLLWKLRRSLNIGDERRLGEELATVNEFAMGVVRERKRRKTEEMESSSDLLSRFISKGAFSDEFLRDIIINFVLAGRDTTSSAMAWFLWLAATRPGFQQKILEEISSVRSRHHNPGGALTLDELREMNYLHAAVSEGLRLYSPVPLQPRQCLADDVLPDGTAVKKGMSVTYNTYAMGRMEGIWGEDCKEFKPERWLDGDGVFQPESPFRFPVFHAGPRTCLGKEMAYTQMKAVVASVMERFEIEVVGEKEKEIEFTTSLRMRGGLPVRVKERDGKRR